MTESTVVGNDAKLDVSSVVEFEFCDEKEGSIWIKMTREDSNSSATLSSSFDLEAFRDTVCSMLMMMYRCSVDPYLPVEVERAVRGQCPICGSESCATTHTK